MFFVYESKRVLYLSSYNSIPIHKWLKCHITIYLILPGLIGTSVSYLEDISELADPSLRTMLNSELEILNATKCLE